MRKKDWFYHFTKWWGYIKRGRIYKKYLGVHYTCWLVGGGFEDWGAGGIWGAGPGDRGVHMTWHIRFAYYLSNVKISNTLNNLTQWGSNFMRSNLTSHVNITKAPRKHISWTFCGVSMIIKSNFKIDLIISEPHYVKFIFLLTSSIDQVFDILTFDKQLAWCQTSFQT